MIFDDVMLRYILTYGMLSVYYDMYSCALTIIRLVTYPIMMKCSSHTQPPNKWDSKAK